MHLLPALQLELAGDLEVAAQRRVEDEVVVAMTRKVNHGIAADDPARRLEAFAAALRTQSRHGCPAHKAIDKRGRRALGLRQPLQLTSRLQLAVSPRPPIAIFKDHLPDERLLQIGIESSRQG